MIACELPRLEDILNLGSKNTNGAYGYAFLHIFPSVYGWVHHKNQVHLELQSKIFNATDEALALLLLENNYDMWTAPKGVVCDPKYTVRFVREVQEEDESSILITKRNPGYGGWSFQGIKRFQNLIEQVKIDRRKVERKQMEEKFLEYMKAQGDDSSRKRKLGEEPSLDEKMMKSEWMWNSLVAEDSDEDELQVDSNLEEEQVGDDENEVGGQVVGV